MMTFGEFAEAIAGLRALPPLERERECVRLGDAAREVLALERGRALAEAVAGGVNITALARQYGVSRSSLNQPLAAWRESRERRALSGPRLDNSTG